MAYVYNKGDKRLQFKFGFEDEWIVIEPNSEISIPDMHAHFFLGFEVPEDALITCVNRLQILGNDIDLNYLKEQIKVTPVKETKRAKA